MTEETCPKIEIVVEDCDANEREITMLARITIPRDPPSHFKGQRTEPVARALARISLFDILGKFVGEIEKIERGEPVETRPAEKNR